MSQQPIAVDVIAAERAAALSRIAAYEATLRRGFFTRVLRLLGRTAAFAWVYRRIGPALDTWLGRRFKGQASAWLHGLPSLLLTTTGARSGLARTSPLLYVRDGEDFIVVGTNFGQAHHPAWTNNLLANPRASVEVGAERVAVDGALLDEAAFAAHWRRLVELYPGYAGYLARSGRTPRMFRLHPAS